MLQMSVGNNIKNLFTIPIQNPTDMFPFILNVTVENHPEKTVNVPKKRDNFSKLSFNPKVVMI